MPDEEPQDPDAGLQEVSEPEAEPEVTPAAESDDPDLDLLEPLVTTDDNQP